MAVSRVAIDLGAFGMLAAVDVGDGEPRRLNLNADGTAVRSVVAISPSGRLVGGARAEEICSTCPALATTAPLRLVEDGVAVTAIGSQVVRTRDVVAALLDVVIEALPGTVAPAELVLAVPAAWDDRRDALVVEAGLRIIRERPVLQAATVRLVRAPAAAAAFLAARATDRSDVGRELVVDVGYERVQGTIDALGVTASRPGGGVVLDDALFAWAIEQVATDPRADRVATDAVLAGDLADGSLAVAAWALREALRAALPVLGTAVTVEVRLPVGLGHVPSLTIGREEVGHLAEPLVRIVEMVVDDLLAAADRGAAGDARLVAVGDASASPAIRSHLHERFGRRFGVLAEPKLTTARGALLVPAT